MSKAINIDGHGKSAADIAGEYITYITDKHFNLTIDDICSYIGCTYTYFLTNFRNNIEHMYINTPARKMLRNARQTNAFENVDYSLIRKKILYSKADFQNFIYRCLKAEVLYKSFTLKDFEGHNKFSSLGALCDEANAAKLLNQAALELFGQPSKHITASLGDIAVTLPEKLYSLEEVKTALGYRYNNQVYRYISSYGVTKYRLNNLVRYDIRDFEKDRIMVNYEKYLDSESDTWIIGKIIDYASGLSAL